MQFQDFSLKTPGFLCVKIRFLCTLLRWKCQNLNHMSRSPLGKTRPARWQLLMKWRRNCHCKDSVQGSPCPTGFLSSFLCVRGKLERLSGWADGNRSGFQGSSRWTNRLLHFTGFCSVAILISATQLSPQRILFSRPWSLAPYQGQSRFRLSALNDSSQACSDVPRPTHHIFCWREGTDSEESFPWENSVVYTTQNPRVAWHRLINLYTKPEINLMSLSFPCSDCYSVVWTVQHSRWMICSLVLSPPFTMLKSTNEESQLPADHLSSDLLQHQFTGIFSVLQRYVLRVAEGFKIFLPLFCVHGIAGLNGPPLRAPPQISRKRGCSKPNRPLRQTCCFFSPFKNK